jgi:23S rRNA (guanosine2251-2'-O)-methyltransferase
MSRVVFGVRPIEELCRARPRDVVIVYVADGYRSKEIETAVGVAKDRGITVEFRPRALVADLAASSNHQGMVAVAGEFQYARVDAMLAAAAEKAEPALLLILDCITDPQNFGALVRSAEVLGAHGVIVPDKHAAPVTGSVVKASAGASERLPIARVHNLLGTIDWLREQGIAVWGGAADEGAVALDKADLRGPVALIIGGEGRGLRTAVARRCSSLVQIPQRGHVASLNASVAGAILLYEAIRQRSTAATSG